MQFSGGIGSFCAALRVAQAHGTDNLVLLIADTRVEDPDLWRFATQAAEHIGVPLTVVTDGRTPFEVFTDRRFLGNSRLAPCSIQLKQRPCRRWLREHTDPASTVLYVGIDWTELRRTYAIEAGWRPWPVKFPMCDPPLLSKEDMLAECRRLGIEPPRLYGLGFSHNNCGGVCVRAGQRQWLHLLRVFPDRFHAAERHEQQLRDQLGDVAILRERRGGISRPLTLRELRRRHESGHPAGQTPAHPETGGTRP
ncbi:hypothetical protein ABZS66_22740 [Dactylosporangium sp. NPDC005572]|uniref:hypothetical protein n=1 Tax=Dactylosporangium sp. NPDC005572 TaxID=3156889 RepID=UPI00339F47AF